MDPSCVGRFVQFADGASCGISAAVLFDKMYAAAVAEGSKSDRGAAGIEYFERLCAAFSPVTKPFQDGTGSGQNARVGCDQHFVGHEDGFDVGVQGQCRCGLRLRDFAVDTGTRDVGAGAEEVVRSGCDGSGVDSNCLQNGSVDRTGRDGDGRVEVEAHFSVDGGTQRSDSDGVVGSEIPKRGKHYAKNLAKRVKRKLERKSSCSTGSSFVEKFRGQDDRSELQRSFDARRIAENKLAVQKAEFQLKRNEYMTKSRVAELEWETRRLQTDQKLEKITVARLGSKPGFAETLVENNISSTSLPSLSKGTISPDSSISVEEVRKMERLIETLAGQVQSLTTELTGLKENVRAQQLFGGKHDLDENDKIIIPRFKTPDERLEWMNGLSDKELEALGPDYHRDGRKVEDGSRLSFDGYTEDYSLQDEAMKEAGISMIG